MSIGSIIWIYLGIQALLFIVIYLLSKLKDKRLTSFQGKQIPPGCVRTDEVSFDPSTGKRLTVYYNPDTGKRFYHEE